MQITDIREFFAFLLKSEKFIKDKSGRKVIEVQAAQFIADQPAIFGAPNEDWHRRELNWYLSQSLNVNDIEPPIPQIWKAVADPNGFINSNYGWAIFSEQNGNQYKNVVEKLRDSSDSRQAQMIYTRPSMHTDWNYAGRQDFMCCSNTIHHIRDGGLQSMVYFRSNDAWAGYKGDYAWMNYVHSKLVDDLGANKDKSYIIWNAASLHIYENQFYLVDHYDRTGEISIPKDEYRQLYPNSQWI